MSAPGDVQVRVRSFGEVVPPEVREALLRRAAEHAIGIIKRRTAKGIGVDGETFPAYSKGYAKAKAGSGRNTRPDLTLSGEMLNGMTLLDANAERALIGFTGSGAPYQFKRMRTAKGKRTSRKLPRGGRATHNLSRSSAGKPVANAIKAKVNNDGLGKAPRRHFFGLSVEERRQVISEAARTLKLKR